MNQTMRMGGIVAVTTLGAIVVLASPASALTLDITYGPSVASDFGGQATQFENAFNGVAAQFDNAITNPITVNVDVSAGTINSTTGLPTGNPSGSVTDSVLMGNTAATSFAATETALGGTGAVLPAINPTGGGQLYVMPQAEFKALGLPPATFAALNAFDGYIGFANNINEFSFSGTPTSSQYSFQALAMHELEEVLGRTSSLNDNGATAGSIAYPFDLFRYSSPGVTSFSENAFAYASTDGGVTDLGTLDSTITDGDRSDWATPINTTSTDAQNAIQTQGEIEGLSISDEDVLEALGYTIAPGNGDGLFNGANAPAGATSSINAVPEPAGMPLLAAGAGLAGWIRHRPRQPVLT